ncbi:MAG: hypothetical protein KAI47_05225, partial [Deltaproteobacteria bacterium]|nr:hypothetical protein [Deltaproteobacteria bacterium]
MPVTRSPSPELSFAELPFAEQLAFLDARVVAREALAALVTETAQLADHQPFAELVRRLLSASLLDDGDVAEALGDALKQMPATGIQRLLRTLGENAGAADAVVAEHFIAIVAATLPELPVSRVAAICLLDRWLKNEAPAARDALATGATARVAAAIAAANPDAGPEALASVDDATLLAVPTKAFASLAAAATARGLSDLWDARRERFATTVLKILEAQPKSLSQANAEQLLARRVYTDPG